MVIGVVIILELYLYILATNRDMHIMVMVLLLVCMVRLVTLAKNFGTTCLAIYLSSIALKTHHLFRLQVQ
jgi:hypothetical protein